MIYNEIYPMEGIVFRYLHLYLYPLNYTQIFCIMKQLTLFFLSAFLLMHNQVNATDLVVNGGGAGGTYSSVKEAIDAAAANDRIIIYPQPNGASYSEGTITLTKSIQLLSANEGAFYTIDGNFNITPASAGITITIIGMRLLTGGIQSTIASPAGVRSTINILNDSLVGGLININHDNYNLVAASNYIYGGITMRYGKIIGNHISSGVTVSTDASPNNPNDTVQIIGNLIYFYSGSNVGVINWHSSSQFFSIQNNFLYNTYPSNNINFGLYVSNSKSSLTGRNSIINNTVYKSVYSIYYGFTIATAANSMTDFLNNLVVSPIYQYAYAFSGGSFNAHYNYATSFSWAGITNDGTNLTATNTTLNSVGLVNNVNSNTINGGITDSAYVDINLTRNDVGCYGGSFTIDNFFPITASDWARVFLVTAPRRVLLNGSIQVKAFGFDK